MVNLNIQYKLYQEVSAGGVAILSRGGKQMNGLINRAKRVLTKMRSS